MQARGVTPSSTGSRRGDGSAVTRGAWNSLFRGWLSGSQLTRLIRRRRRLTGKLGGGCCRTALRPYDPGASRRASAEGRPHIDLPSGCLGPAVHALEGQTVRLVSLNHLVAEQSAPGPAHQAQHAGHHLEQADTHVPVNLRCPKRGDVCCREHEYRCRPSKQRSCQRFGQRPPPPPPVRPGVVRPAAENLPAPGSAPGQGC